jgi:hypothetical protein
MIEILGILARGQLSLLAMGLYRIAAEFNPVVDEEGDSCQWPDDGE